MHKTGHSKPVHWDNPEGWDGEGGGGGSGWGTYVHPWLIHVNVWQKPLQYCKVITLQLNKLIKKIEMEGEEKNPMTVSIDIEKASTKSNIHS